MNKKEALTAIQQIVKSMESGELRKGDVALELFEAAIEAHRGQNFHTYEFSNGDEEAVVGMICKYKKIDSGVARIKAKHEIALHDAAESKNQIN